MSNSLKYRIPSVVQYMIANGCVSSEDFRVALIKMMGLKNSSQIDEEKVSKVVEQTNKRLSPFNMMIRVKIDQGTSNKYFVLISKVDNAITRAASHYSPKQFELFRLTLEAIAADPDRRILETHFTELAEKATISTISRTRSTPSEHQVILDEWCAKYWLARITRDDDKFIKLGVRARAELDIIVPDVDPDIFSI